jgi:hypothetical protein
MTVIVTRSGEANAQELENGSRSVYFITYSQADKAVFPTRKDFALGVVKSFLSGKAKCNGVAQRRNTETKETLPYSGKTYTKPTMAHL